jgi:hypothetical protein
VRVTDRWKTSFRSQLGQFEWNVVPFGLQGASSLLIRVMNQVLTVGLDFPGGPTTTWVTAETSASGPAATAGSGAGQQIHGGVPGASDPLGRCALVYIMVWTTVWCTRQC